MPDKKFAFESEKISVAFYSVSGLGDALIARKVLTALIELAPDCVVDFFCVTEAHKNFASAFYGDLKNLNRVLSYQKFYRQTLAKYDVRWASASKAGSFMRRRLRARNVRYFSASTACNISAIVKI